MRPEAGVTLSARTFPHTAAVLLLKRTGDLDLVYKVLGHSSFDVTRKYLRFTTEDIQARYRQANILGAIRKPKKITMRDVDRALRQRNMDEEELSDLLFEAAVNCD